MGPSRLAAAAVAAPRAPLRLLGRGLAAAMSAAGPLKSVDYEVFGRVQGRGARQAGDRGGGRGWGGRGGGRAQGPRPARPGLPLRRDTAAAAGPGRTRTRGGRGGGGAHARGAGPGEGDRSDLRTPAGGAE